MSASTARLSELSTRFPRVAIATGTKSLEAVRYFSAQSAAHDPPQQPVSAMAPCPRLVQYSLALGSDSIIPILIGTCNSSSWETATTPHATRSAYMEAITTTLEDFLDQGDVKSPATGQDYRCDFERIQAYNDLYLKLLLLVSNIRYVLYSLLNSISNYWKGDTICDNVYFILSFILSI